MHPVVEALDADRETSPDEMRRDPPQPTPREGANRDTR